MSATPKPPARYIDGLKLPAKMSEEAVLSVINYKPRDDDVFVVTYPKCGTTWISHICTLIFRHGEPYANSWDYFANAPFLEAMGVAMAETMIRPGSIKMHLPFHLTPKSEKAKYIYVARNPKDNCVSYFHHVKSVPVHDFEGTFDDFFEDFVAGETDYGDYFDHLLGWYPHRNDPNVLFITYEKVKEDIEAAILKLAAFLDEEKYAAPLRNDPQKMANVVKYISLKEMKLALNTRIDEMFNDGVNSDAPESMKEFLSNFGKSHAAKPEAQTEKKKSNFVRKGIIGDWRNYFSEDQSKRLAEKFAERTKGTELANLWDKYMQ